MTSGTTIFSLIAIDKTTISADLSSRGLDPWFDVPLDRLTVLSNVQGLTTLSIAEGESSGFSDYYKTGCRIDPVLNLIGGLA
jgi:hypothetical protein